MVNRSRMRLFVAKLSRPKVNTAENTPAERYCTKLKTVSKILIINEILVEVAGVELITVLRACRLLIPGTATTARRPHCPIHCTFIVRKCMRSRLTLTPHRDPIIPRVRSDSLRKNSTAFRESSAASLAKALAH